MTNLIESLQKGPLMTMTLKCETEFPKALKNLMLSMRMQGEAVYKGFLVIDEGQEYRWSCTHKKMRPWMYIYIRTKDETLECAPIQEQGRRPQEDGTLDVYQLRDVSIIS
jgi:hypothetical protein